MEITDWESTDTNFIQTPATDHILDVLLTNDVITIVGSSGIGKSVTLQHVALHLRDKYGYQIIPCRNTSDIQLHVRQGMKYVLVIDDVCGKYVLVQTEIDEWNKYQSFLTKLLSKNKIKLLTSCRKTVYNDCKFQLLKVFCKNICDLSVGDYALTATEKSEIALKYIPSAILNEIKKDLDRFDFFPLMCYLYTTRSISNALKFFGNTFANYEVELDQLKAETDKTKLCAIFLCVLFNGCLDECLLTADNETFIQETDDRCEHQIPIGTAVKLNLSRKVLLEIFDDCGVDLNTPKSRILEQLEVLVNTYLIKRDNNFVFIHDKLFDYICFYFGNYLQRSILKHANSVLIRDRCRLKETEADAETFSIIIYRENEEKYFERIINDILTGDIYDVFYNNQMQYQSYRTKLMKSMSINPLNLNEICAQRADSSVDGMDPVTSLYLACLEGYTDIVNYILDNTDCQFDKDYYPLNAAAYRGRNDVLDLLIQKGFDVNHRDVNGHTPLAMACIGKNKESVRLLIEGGADVDKRTSEGPTPLMWACSSDYKGVADILLYKGADIDKADYKGQTPVMWCRKQGGSGIFDLLMYKGANLNKRDNSGWSPLMWATNYGLLSTVEVLLAKNVNIDESDDSGLTPLMIACEKGYTEIILFLIRNGVNINSKNEFGQTALMLSCASDNFNVLQILIDNNAAINSVDKMGKTALIKVCSLGLEVNADWLLQKGADVKISDNEGFSPLSVACFDRHNELVNILIKHGADVNQINSDGSTILISTCNGSLNEYMTRKSNQTEYANEYVNTLKQNCVTYDINRVQLLVIDILLKNAVEVDKTDIIGWSPLMWACSNKDINVASILIDNGANVNHTSEDGKTIFQIAFITKDEEILHFLFNKGVCSKHELMEAIKTENMQIFDWILKKKMNITNKHISSAATINQTMKYDINWTNEDGFTPLVFSCKHGCIRFVHFLISLGADVNIPDSNGNTPLHYCCINENKKLVRLLVLKGANINLFSKDKWNPLIHFCHKENHAMVKLLLELEADVNVENGFKQTPLRYACLSENIIIAQELIAKGADAYHELSYANENKDTDVVKFVLQIHPCVTQLLQNACKKHDSELIYLLIDAAMKDLPNELDETLYLKLFGKSVDPAEILELACKSGSQNLLKAALASGVDVNQTYKSKKSPLIIVCFHGYSSSVKVLIERGADINQIDSNGWSPLRWACQGKNDDVMTYLLSYGANFEKDLLDALDKGEKQVFETLIKKGANVNESLMYACKVGRYAVIDSLLKNGADICFEDDDGWTPLMRASYNGYSGIVSFLLKRGSQPNKDLLTAARLKDDQVFNMLITAGANIDETFIMACKQNDSSVEYLIRKGADINTCMSNENNYPLK